ncbi:fumarate reductase, flavoprotein subunit [Idiomarina sp. A28L]|uniref:fumarate reductase (quinol) flavoprotein subunit n=1 Tax=Idiomarina sp. A28L TaxID=1036674 RepID=UPI0002138D2D|nr:fumarate reductase (quinol) flavoprotein subunit [Idiomarina sp. A28L]EGN75478.1 fumarate reductase, flavoprotein subunit [Idiomarina sp. A28L]
MQQHEFDIIVVGGGGAGLRAAIAAAEAGAKAGSNKAKPLNIAMLSKVYPMRSHTVAAEGGAAAVTRPDDTVEAHFDDTVAGGDWLAEQGVVDYFVRHAYQELVQMEHWGCPWSRKPNGDVQVRRFGGMKTERTWFAADKTGFHMLHTLFQTSLKYPSIQRFDEYFVLDLLVSVQQQVQGVLALEISTGELHMLYANAVIMATGGAGRVFRFNTNGGIVTGDGMAIAYRHGVPLRDMEFVQYHPTGLPGSGILITEACRGEGGLLVNKDGYRYLQDYGLGPETPLGKPENKYMELGPRDKLSQAFWHEQKAGRTGKHHGSDVVYLDLRHLGKAYLYERLPFICELAKAYVDVDPVHELIPIRPAVHYTMGGIETDAHCETTLKGLFAAGECASVGLHGANRLGSNSLTELLVFGRLAGEQAAARALQKGVKVTGLEQESQKLHKKWQTKLHKLTDTSQEARSWVPIKRELVATMETGCGIYRDEQGLQQALDSVRRLQAEFQHVRVGDNSKAYNTDLLHCLELEFSLDVAEAICLAALERRESRGAHQRLDADCTERNDAEFLRHSQVFYVPGKAAKLKWQAVDTHISAPGERLYGSAGSAHAGAAAEVQREPTEFEQKQRGKKEGSSDGGE